MKDYKKLKQKKRLGTSFIIIGIILILVLKTVMGDIGSFIGVAVMLCGLIVYVKHDYEIYRCPHCNKSNADFSGGGSQASIMAYVKLTKKCRYCGGELPEEMF